ncbi:MAG: hypothetical protein V7609_3291 [Verrucomicrobiota bacterium]
MHESFFHEFVGRHLRGGFAIVRLEAADALLADALGREAIARTYIIGSQFFVTIRSGLSDKELSVTIYHEILEAATVASIDPPDGVRNFNEHGFERAAYQAHEQFGEVSPENLDRMLQFYGF